MMDFLTDWSERLCSRVTGHRWIRVTSAWRWGMSVLGPTWCRESECRVCGRGFIEWQTWKPE